MKILLVATRHLEAPQTGRKLVLKTILRSCEALGHEVHVAVIGAAGQDGCYVSLAGPRVHQVLGNFIWHFLLGRKSLNECLYWSEPAQRQINTLVARDAYQLVVADMVRTAQFCVRLRVPWILDLDDLLSERYARLAEVGAAQSLLGYFAERVPRGLRGTAARLARWFLRTEARRIGSQELHFGTLANAVTLVSSVEAGSLSKRLGRAVHDAGASFTVMGGAAAEPSSGPTNAVVFIGGLSYQPNLDAVSYFLGQIGPELEKLGCAAKLHVIGEAPLDLRPADPSGRASYSGYVDDLATEIGRYSIFVAPILAEGGLKTKVLEAMANGLAVVATEQAVTGLGLTSNEHCIVANSPGEFATAIQWLTNDADACMRLGNSARQFVRSNFSHEVLQEKWRGLLDDAVANHQSVS